MITDGEIAKHYVSLSLVTLFSGVTTTIVVLLDCHAESWQPHTLKQTR